MVEKVKDWVVKNIGKASAMLTVIIGSLGALAGYLAAVVEIFGK